MTQEDEHTATLIGSHGRKLIGFALFVMVLLAALALAGTGRATIESPPPPQVWSDKADYAPGETVTLSGANWAPGEAVHIRVNDDAGQTWSRDVDVTAADDGTISDQFNLPTSFVALYSVTATGASSGTATWSFTDGNLTLHLSTSEGVADMSVPFQNFGKNSSPDGTCSTTGTTPGGSPKTATSGGTASIGVQSFESVKLGTVTTTTAGKIFDRWTTGTPTTDSGVTVSGSPTPCIGGSAGGTNGNVTDLYAHFKDANQAPSASAGGPYSGNEGAPISLDGSGSSDPDAGDTLTYAWTFAKGVGVRAAATCSFSSATAQSPTFSCTDNGSYTVSLTVTDNHGASSAASAAAVTVANVAPTATFNAPASVNEGSNINLSLTSPSDASSVDTSAGFTYAFDCGDGSGYGAFSATSTATCSTTDNGSRNVGGKIRDQDNDETEYTASVTVSNVAPTATLANNGPVDEGSAATISFSAQSDPSSADTSAGFHYAYHCDGSAFSPAPTYTGTVGSSASTSCTFNDNGSKTVRARIIDKDNGFTEYTTAVTVNNVVPTATLFNNGPVDEGSAATISFSAQSDPSSADTAAGFHYAYHCDGSAFATDPTYAGTAGSTASTSCTFNDNGSKTVRARIIDKDGGYSEYTTTVTVSNVAPTGDLGNDGPIDEGSSATVSFSNQHDPSSADTAAGFHYAFSCANASLGGATYATSGSVDSTSCSFSDNGTFTVRARIIDKDGGFTEYTTAVVVRNVAPTASLANNGPVDEGSAATISFSAQSDPSSADTAAGFHYAYHCDGSAFATDPTYAGTAGSTASTSCTFNDNGSKTVRARIIDKDNGFTEYTTTVTVSNVAPTADLANDGPVDEGSPATISFSNQFDPSSADTSAGFHYAYSCTNGSLAGATYASASASASAGCTFDDNASFTVRARIIDKDGGYSEYTTTVTVSNVAPTGDLGNDGPIDEGSAATVSFSNQSDPSSADTAAGFHYAFSCANASLAAATYATSGSVDSTSCPFSDNGTFTVRARIIDKDNGFTEYTTAVTVNNVGPTATLSNNGPVDEGSAATISFSGASDPSNDDTSAGFHYAYSCDGSAFSPAPTYTGTVGSSASTSCTFNDNGSKTVRARIIDKDNGFTEYTTTVTVSNVAPTASFPSTRTVDEGTSSTFAFTSQSDPSSADTSAGFHYAFSCTGGSLAAETYASSGTADSKSCTFGDGPGSQTVRARIIDKDGGFTEYTTAVTVTNVAPTGDLGNNGPIDEGSSATVSFSNQHDPSSADTAAGFHYAFSCSNGSLAGATYIGSSTASTTSCSYDDNGTYTVRGRIIDKDGGFTEYTTAVTVRNVAPTATLSNNGPVDEGSAATISFSGASDPSGPDTAAGFHYAFACNGGSLSAATYSGSGTAASKQCTFTDDTGQPFTVRARIIDKDGGYSEYTTAVTVNNVPPVITDVTASNTFAGPLVFMTSTISTFFTDPGSDTWTNLLTFSDGGTETGTSPTSEGGNDYKFTLTHSFLTPGCKTVTSRVTDDDGGYGTFGPTAVNVGTGEFLPPMTNTRVTNKLKNGQVLPVKVKLTDCNGVAITNLSPAIILKEGDLTTASDDGITPITVDSVSGADTTGIMRSVDGYYIYNMKVNVPRLNQDYTLIIYPYGSGVPSQSIRHVIQATK